MPSTLPTANHDSLSKYVPMSLYEDYFKQVFPQIDFVSHNLDVMDWISRDSLDVFLNYHTADGFGAFLPIVEDPRLVQQASRSEIDAYRRFVLPPLLRKLSYFSYDNVDRWVSPKHFTVYLKHVYPHDLHEELHGGSPSELYHGSTLGGRYGRRDRDDNFSGEEEVQPDDSTEIDNSTEVPQPGDLDDPPVLLEPRFTLPQFKISHPIVIPFETDDPEVTEFCVFPNFSLFFDLYFRKASNYMERSFLQFYDAHQAAYSVPSDSAFAREHVAQIEREREYNGGLFQSVAVAKDPQYPVEYYDPGMYQRHPEIGAIFTLVEWRARRKRGLSLTESE